MRQICLALPLLAACGGGMMSGRMEPFASSYPDNIGGDLDRALARLSSGPRPTKSAVLVAGVPGRDEVVGWDLSAGRKLWSAHRKVEARPIVSQGLAIFPSGGSIVALDVRTGRLRFEVDSEGREFRGAAVCPSTKQMYVTLGGATTTQLDEDAGRSVLVAVSDTGSVRWREEVDRTVGAPAALGGLVLVPWDQQYLSALEGENGNEIARVRSTDDVIRFVTATNEGVYYGAKGIYRLTPRSAGGTQGGADRIAPDLGEVPGDATIGADTFAPRPARGARDRIRFHWRAAEGAATGVSLQGDAIYFQYFRYLFAFAPDGSLRWVHRHAHDLVTAYPLPDGIVVAGEDGSLGLLTADTGQVVWTGSMGTAIEVAEIDASGFAPPRSAPGEDSGLRARLLELAYDTDNRMVPARQFAIRRLAKIEDAAITGDLIEIASRRSLAPGVRQTAGQMLLDRTTGQAELLAALGRHYSFLDGIEAPPVGIIARAAARMEARDALPALLAHLEDHETEAVALPDLVAAIKTLGDATAAPGLLEFLTRYHADDTIGDEGRSLVVAAEAVGAWGDEAHAQEVARMAEDPYTIPPLVTPLRAASAEILARVHPSDTVDTTQEQAAEQAVEPPAEPAIPRLLDNPAVAQVLGAHDGAVRRCANEHRGRSAPPARLRLSFLLMNDGRMSNITMTPPNDAMLNCFKPLIENTQFPTFTEARQTINFTFQVRP